MKIEYEKIEEILRNLINDCGENILLESNKMSSLLKDYFPRMDTERNLLLEVTKIGIWNKLISLKTKKKNLQIFIDISVKKLFLLKVKIKKIKLRCFVILLK